jgi:uncharacterized protein YwgA
MAKSTLIPLALLYTQNRTGVEGATRFQKLIFLAQKETDIPDKYNYHADKFGPFSIQLHTDLQELTNWGVIERSERTNEVGNSKYVYAITTDGMSLVQNALESGDHISKVFEDIQRIKQHYNDEPLQELLRYVYQKYPTYATKTDLDTDRLFDPDARSQFLEPDGADFVGTAPGEWKEVNSSAQDLFSV